MLAEKRRIYRRFSARLDSEAARVVIEPQTDRHQPALRDSLSPRRDSRRDCRSPPYPEVAKVAARNARGRPLVFDPAVGSCGVVLDDAMGVLCEFGQLPERR